METSHKKITQAINWLAKLEGGEINKMKAIKLIWMADRLHLREYGRPITNDDYVAMKFGPVGSLTRNITDEATPYLTDEQLGYARKYIKKIGDNICASVNDVDTSVFSKSEIDTLKAVQAEFGQYDQFELCELTHEFPEWSKFKELLDAQATNQVQMSYEDFFKEPNPNSELLNGKFSAAKNLFAQTEADIHIAKQTFDEIKEMNALWT